MPERRRKRSDSGRSERRSSKRRGRSGFQYKKRDPDSVKRRSTASSGDFDSPFKDNVTMLSLKEGDTKLRILPRSGECDHYGLDIHQHFDIGPDKGSYLSLSKMKGAPDPIREELTRAQKDGEDADYLKSLKPTKRVLMWVIDRTDEENSPKLWACPFSLDKEICLQAQDKETGEVLLLDDPDEGYDVIVTRKGTGLNTKYSVQVARRSRPIYKDSEDVDEVLNFISENPLEDVLVYHDYDYIKGQLEASGGASVDYDEDDEDDDDEDLPRSRSGSKRRSKYADPEDEEEDEEWEDEDEDDEYDDDWEDDPKPKKRKRDRGRR